MLLQPTEKARLELHPGVQTLALRERSVLLLAHGISSPLELRRLFNGMGAQILQDLLRQGYLAAAPDRCEPRAEPEEVQQSLDNDLDESSSGAARHDDQLSDPLPWHDSDAHRPTAAGAGGDPRQLTQGARPCTNAFSSRAMEQPCPGGRKQQGLNLPRPSVRRSSCST